MKKKSNPDPGLEVLILNPDTDTDSDHH